MSRVVCVVALVVLSLYFASAVVVTRQFVTSAKINQDGTATFPLYQGVSAGAPVYFIITDSSDGNLAQALGVNKSPKLANAANTAGVQKVTIKNGVINFPGNVDFTRVLFPGQAGSIGINGYSPMIQLPNGTVLNAPIVANEGGKHDLVTNLDLARKRVTMKVIEGFAFGKAVKYILTEVSNDGAASFGPATFADALAKIPTQGDDSGRSGRSGIILVANGQTSGPERQGLNSIVPGVTDSPLNVFQWAPNQGAYSPAWDSYIAIWSANATVTRQTDFGKFVNLAQKGLITSGATPFQASGIVENCPILAEIDAVTA